MSRPRSRTAAAVVTALVAVVLFASSTGAQADTTTPGAFHAKADATALNLTVFGQGLSLGLTHAENESAPKAAADSIGALVPGLGNQTEATAAAEGTTTLDDQPQICGPITLPANFPVVSLATACASAKALLTDGLPSSVSDASVATIDVNANQVLGPVATPLNQPIGNLLNGLTPVFDALKNAGVDANSLLDQILAAITQDGTIIRVSLGPSHSTSDATSGIEKASATAQGATIQLLPRDTLGLAPVATIEVGASGNTISVDRATGTATVAFDPALVRITLAPDIAATLPSALPNPIEVAPGQSFCLGLPAPLDSCITVAGGTSSTDPNGVTHAEASAVSLHLLTGVQDGVRLDLANTRVEGVGALDVSRDAPAPAPTVEDQAPLARTGGSTPLPLVAVLVAMAMVGATLSRSARRREVLSHR